MWAARSARSLVPVALVLALVGCSDAGGDVDAAQPTTTATAPSPEGWADVVDEVLPAVVSIRHPGGAGSGVILDAGGVVVTNAHVVTLAEHVEVVFADGTSSVGEVVATDEIADLAVVRVDRIGLPVAEVAIDLPEAGDRALAVGSPLGFEHTVTAGIVSGLHRSIPAGGPALVDLVQTDAPISPGSSGGALVDASGALIGINVAYIAPQAGAVSLGFAIPSSTVVDTVEELLEDGTAEHPWLGLRPAPLSAAVAEQYDVPVEQGVLVLAVVTDGPAHVSGIERGDVITAVDGIDISRVEDLLAILRDREPGDRLALVVRRGDARQEVSVRLGDWPVPE